MKTITLRYQIWSRCEQEIEVPDDYVKPEGIEGWALFEDLRKKYPDHDIWDYIPDNDGDFGVDIEDHLEYIDGSGLNIEKRFREDRSVYYVDPYGFDYEIDED